jgi:putative addiction module component (TIGR02574 family)
MPLTLQELKDASSSLAPPERAELARFLLLSLDAEEEGWADAWREELSRRLQEIHSGAVVGVPAEDVLARLRER